MVSKTQFQDAITTSLLDEFGGAAAGFEEVAGDVVGELYGGKAESYLVGDKTPSKRAEMEFGPLETAAAAALAVIPVLELAKVAAEAYLVLEKRKQLKEPEDSISSEGLEAELAAALMMHMSKNRAQRIAASVTSRLR